MSLSRQIFLFGVVVLFIGTAWETGITGKDEYWVTLRTPLEMMEDNSYWTLRLNDEVRLQKPPLIYWFIASLYQLTGVQLWAARLVGVLSGAGMAALTVKLYKRLFGSSGFLAGLILLTCAGVAVEGRRAMLDLPLGFFCLASVYAAVAAVQDRNRKAWAVSGAMLAAATLSKGPQSLLFVLPALLLGYALHPARPGRKQVLSAAALMGGVFLIITLPWPLSMRMLHADFIAELETQIVDNRLSKIDPMSPVNALGGTLLLAIPWSFVLLQGLIQSFRGDKDRRHLWLAGWLLLSISPFFFMKAFERYMIPVLPCAALLIARTLESLGPRVRRAHLITASLLLGLVSILLSVFGLWFQLTFWSSLFTLGLTFWMLFISGVSGGLIRPIAAMVWVMTFALGVVYPRLGVNAIPEDLPWDDLHRNRVGIYSKYSQPAMLSMRLRRSVEFPREDRLNEQGFEGYIFTTHDQFVDPDPNDDRVAFLDHALRTAGLTWEETGRYPVLFSRRNWIKFTRPGTDWDDWKTALKTRDLSPLMSEIVYVKVGEEKGR